MYQMLGISEIIQLFPISLWNQWSQTGIENYIVSGKTP